MKKILIINIFGIGDVLFTTPLIRNLKLNFPQCTIGFVANSRGADILRNNPDVDKVFIYDRAEWNQLWQQSKGKFWQRAGTTLDSIRQEKYDVLIDVSLNGYASFLMAIAGIPKRIGLNFKNRGTFLTHKIEFKGYENKHVVEYYLDLLTQLGLKIHSRKLELNVSVEDRLWAEEKIRTNLAPNKPIIVLVPGGGASWGKDASFKRWPAAQYAQLADKIIENYDAQIILLGGPDEKDLCQSVAQQMKKGCFNLAGSTTLGQMAAVLQRSLVAVVNDGGPLHVAVAVDAKTVSIFGPVDERVYGPYPAKGHKTVTVSLPCRPCYRQFRRASCQHVSCLGLISVDQVLKNIDQSLTQHEHSSV